MMCQQCFSTHVTPEDEPYISLALAAEAQYLVSRDNDLLALSGTSSEAVLFRKRFPMLTILDPVAFLRLNPE